MAIGQGFSLSDVVNGAIGNFPGNCMGYMNPGGGGSGYIATMTLSVDKVDMTGLDPGAGGIVSYDPCEKDAAQGIVPVYPVWPLLDAAERLFGRVDKTGDGETDLRRFPPLRAHT